MHESTVSSILQAGFCAPLLVRLCVLLKVRMVMVQGWLTYIRDEDSLEKISKGNKDDIGFQKWMKEARNVSEDESLQQGKSYVFIRSHRSGRSPPNLTAPRSTYPTSCRPMSRP